MRGPTCIICNSSSHYTYEVTSTDIEIVGVNRTVLIILKILIP